MEHYRLYQITSLGTIMTVKKCSKCKQVKSIDEFHKDKQKKTGLASCCILCRKGYAKENRERITQYQRDLKKINPTSSLFYQAKHRAIKKNLSFDLTIEWLQERYTGYCELTGIKFQQATKGKSPISPSIDRIDSSKGYTKDNIRIIIWALNASLGNWGIEAYERISKAYWNNKGYKIIQPE